MTSLTGIVPIPIPKPKLSRATSLTVSNQTRGTCFAHASSRILARFIKVIGRRYFDSAVVEKCSYYYKEYCALNPFECFNKNLSRYKSYTAQPSHLDVLNFRKSRAQKYFKKYPSCLGDAATRDETENLKENIFAALYSYIYITITSKYGCNGGKTAEIIDDFLHNNLNSEISVEDIAFTLNFAKPCTESTCFPVIKSAKQIETVLKIPYVRLICEALHSVLNGLKNEIKESNYDIYASAITVDDIGEKFNSRIEHLKKRLDLGFYGGLFLKVKGERHAMVITSYEDVIVNGIIADTNFVVKNSVGVDFIYYVQGNRQEKGVFKISLSSIIPQIKLDEAAIAYIVITQPKPNENPNIKELKSSGGRHKKKRKTKRQRVKQNYKSNKTRTKH
jgi:hypothetical protein